MGGVSYPNESDAYRRARNELLSAEADLRAQIEAVAEQRRRLPPGGAVPHDYQFTELVAGQRHSVRLSELFGAGHDTLFVYSFMFAPEMDAACPMCTALLDGLDGQIRHLSQMINTAVVAKHDIDAIHEHADTRGWTDLRLLSSSGTRYNVDYHAERDGEQRTTANVFVRDGEEIRHFWGTELAFQPPADGQDMRHVDALWPLYNALDMTPNGRGDFYPALDYF